MTRPAAVHLFALVLAACGSGGCAALTNPVADGVPVRRLPDEVFGRPKSELREVPLNLLRINDPGDYRLDKGDTLAIVADEILTKQGQPIPVQFLQNPNLTQTTAQGVPVPVQDDGTIILPLLDPIDVKGKTLLEVRAAIVNQIVNVKKIIVKGEERVQVALLQPRRYRVLVVREDAQLGGPQVTSFGNIAAVTGATQRGSAYSLLLEPGRNDVLQALSLTGGPPGLDSRNEVVIRRGKYDPADPAKGYTRVPLRARADEPLRFTQADITLGDGDTVLIQARDTEVYYTAGLLGRPQIPLPRDYDLRVIQAISQVRGPLINGSFNQNAFVASAVNSGIGNPSPSLVTVIRKLPNLQNILIRVDLNVAFRDERENIIIQPGDTIVMQERPSEAFARYMTQQFRVLSTYQFIRSRFFNSTLTGSNP